LCGAAITAANGAAKNRRIFWRGGNNHAGRELVAASLDTMAMLAGA
jgi:hypothetical protein